MSYHTNIKIEPKHTPVLQQTTTGLQRMLTTAFGLEQNIEHMENAYAALGCRDELSVTIVVNTSQKHEYTGGDVEKPYQVRLLHLTDTQRKAIIDIMKQERQACYSDLDKMVTIYHANTGEPGTFIEAPHLCESCRKGASCTLHHPHYGNDTKLCYQPPLDILPSQAAVAEVTGEQPWDDPADPKV